MYDDILGKSESKPRPTRPVKPEPEVKHIKNKIKLNNNPPPDPAKKSSENPTSTSVKGISISP